MTQAINANFKRGLQETGDREDSGGVIALTKSCKPLFLFGGN